MKLLYLDESTFEEEVLQSETPVLVDFYADWCVPCKMLSPLVEEIAADFEDSLKVVKFDVDQSQEIAVAYNIMNIPALLLFEDGKVKSRVVGVRPKQNLIAELGLHANDSQPSWDDVSEDTDSAEDEA